MSCVYNCFADTGGTNWSGWLQTGIAAIAVIVAALVPTAIFRHERRRSTAREHARAKCVFAISLDLIRTNVLELQVDTQLIQQGDRSEHFLDCLIQDTRVLPEVRDALGIGHEFPKLADQLVAYVLKLDDANACSIATKNNAARKWLDGDDPYDLRVKFNLAADAGVALTTSIQAIMRESVAH